MSELTYKLTNYDQKEISTTSYKEYVILQQIYRLMLDKKKLENSIQNDQESLDLINKQLADLKV